MAHFAEIGLNNTVLRVIVVGNDDCKDQYGNESEVIGAKFCNTLFGGVWLQTSYNGTIRKNYAGVNYTYDSTRNAFIAPKPYASWTLNQDSYIWEAPVAMPTEGGPYSWNEETKSWDAVTESTPA